MRQPKQDRDAQEKERRETGVAQENWDQAYEWVEEEAGGKWVEMAAQAEPGPPPQNSDQPFVVWACNWPALEAFRACETRWRRDADGSFWLDYNGVDVVMRRRKIADELFEKIQAMEFAALGVLNG